MDPFTHPLGWALLAVAGAGVLAVLHSIANHLKHERRIHDLRIRVSELRQSQLERLRKLADDAASVHVEVVGGEPSNGSDAHPHSHA